MTPKERVRTNVYKSLLEEEKRRNKKITMFSCALFVFGIFTSSTLTNLNNKEEFSNVAMNGNVVSERNHSILDKIYESGILEEEKISVSTDELFGIETKI